ncbi:MAG: 6-carboxytetrahydropterin synthase QueD [Candidatus Wallbacteria bacterium]
MFEISAKFSISSAHFLRNYEGKCKNLHGHNWKITVYAAGGTLSEKTGMLLDFGELKRLMKIIENELDHKSLNECSYFTDANPTAENIAKYVYQRMSFLIEEHGHKNVKISKVSVFETENCEALYYE